SQRGRQAMFLKTTIATLAAASMFVAASAKAGEAHPDTSAVTVRAPDLNLNTEAGARVMLARITAAAHVVCGPQPAPVELRARPRGPAPGPALRGLREGHGRPQRRLAEQPDPGAAERLRPDRHGDRGSPLTSSAVSRGPARPTPNGRAGLFAL